MIIIGEMQIPAQRFQNVEEAREALKKDEVIVLDGENNYWIIDNENYPKIEAYGYERVEPK